jgi:hypothetical protein
MPIASSTRSTACTVRPSIARFGALALGTSATEKPSLAASFRRSCPRGAGRTSPARPTSPKAKKPRGGAQAALDRQHHGQIGRRLADAHAAHRVDEHVLVQASHAGMTVQHRQQHREAIAVQAHRQPARARPAAVHQRLHLHQQRARAFQRHQHAGAGHRLAVGGQEDRARVAHALEPALRHREHANLVDGAEAVLDCAHEAKARMRVALEVQHRVDDVLKHARAGKRALFRHMAHQHD